MKTVGRIAKIIAATVGGFFACVILSVLAALAWIAYRPVPPVPRFAVQYSVQNLGVIGAEYLDFDGPNPLNWGWRLTFAGKVVQLSAAAEAADKARRAASAARVAHQIGFHPAPDAPYPEPNPVVAVSPDGHALIYRGDGSTVWTRKDGRFADAIPRNASWFYKARGYSWPIYFVRFHEINAQDIVIGNGRIATAPASSGGTSSPHGRSMPLVWRPGYRRPEDLNSRIDPDSGWYLDQAVDINGRGQILCVARRTDMKGAEQYDQADAHWVVLTPLR